MKKLALAVLIGAATFAQEYTLHPIKITESLWCVTGDLMPPTKENKGFVSNICWVENAHGLTLLDSGPTRSFAIELEKAISSTTSKKVTDVIITNYHDDRILGADYFHDRGATIIAHKNILTDIQNNPQKFERLPTLLSPEQYAGTKLPTFDVLFEGNSYTLGSVELKKLSTVAETSSDIVVYLPKQKALFAGNILFGERGLNYDKESNLNGWLEALDKIKTLDITHFIPGHGRKTDKSSFDESYGYLSSLYAQTKKAYEDGVELENISKAVLMSEFSYLINYKDRHVQNLYNLYGHLEFETVK